MAIPINSEISLAIAIGIGLLIGAERERRKGSGGARGAAGVRTFALAAFAGALCVYLKSEALLIVVTAGPLLFSALAYRYTSQKDPGLTSEFALLVAVLLGALTMRNALLAAGLSVVVTILLAARGRLHRVLKNLLSEQEAHDALVFLAAALVILPLAPNRELGPYGAFNPRKIWELVILVMSVGAASYIALRALGSRLGLALSGFVGGFISASATIGSMGHRAKRSPELGSAAASGAVLATVATVIQMFLVLLVTNRPTCRALAIPLLFAGVTAITYALIFIAVSTKSPVSHEPPAGRAFDLRLAILFAMTITVILLICAIPKPAIWRSRTFPRSGALGIRRHTRHSDFNRITRVRREAGTRVRSFSHLAGLHHKYDDKSGGCLHRRRLPFRPEITSWSCSCCSFARSLGCGLGFAENSA